MTKTDATPKPLLANYLRENEAEIGTRIDFAARVKVDPTMLSKVINGRTKASPELAIRIHEESRGAVPGSYLRPDIWRNAQDVPVKSGPEAGQ